MGRAPTLRAGEEATATNVHCPRSMVRVGPGQGAHPDVDRGGGDAEVLADAAPGLAQGPHQAALCFGFGPLWGRGGAPTHPGLWRGVLSPPAPSGRQKKPRTIIKARSSKFVAFIGDKKKKDHEDQPQQWGMGRGARGAHREGGRGGVRPKEAGSLWNVPRPPSRAPCAAPSPEESRRTQPPGHLTGKDGRTPSVGN